jgi:hypothetical protein
MSDPVDLKLKALLASRERPSDDAFAHRMTRIVVAEERLRLARRAAWTRFAMEMAAAAALILAFVLLAKTGPEPDSAGIVPLFGPASAGLLLLALWLFVSWRPVTAGSRR